MYLITYTICFPLTVINESNRKVWQASVLKASIHNLKAEPGHVWKYVLLRRKVENNSI